MFPRRRSAMATLAVAALATVLLAAPLAAAGSGYNQTYTRSPTAFGNLHVDLTLLATQDLGGGQLQVKFQTAGTLVLNDPTVSYEVFFGGGGQANSTASVLFSNNTTAGSESSSLGTLKAIPYTLGDAGTSLTFVIAESEVGPAMGFTVNAFASASNPPGTSWLGTDYSVVNAVGNAIGWLAIAIVVFLVVVIVVVVLVVLLTRRKPPTPPAYAPPMGTPPVYAPAPMYAPAPPTQPVPPPPPPPPPP